MITTVTLLEERELFYVSGGLRASYQNLDGYGAITCNFNGCICVAVAVSIIVPVSIVTVFAVATVIALYYKHSKGK